MAKYSAVDDAAWRAATEDLVALERQARDARRAIQGGTLTEEQIAELSATVSSLTGTLDGRSAA